MKRFAIMLFCVCAGPSVRAGEPGVKQTIAYVQKSQTESGGFRLRDPGMDNIEILPTLRATSSALRALRYFGGDIPNKDACIKFVESCHDPKTGGFRDTPNGAPDVFSTAVGLMAVAELKMPTKKYADGARTYLEENAKSFEDIRIAVAAFEAMDVRSAKSDDWLKEVRKMQNEDGTWGKGPGLARDTASRFVTLLRLHAKPNSEPVLKVLKAGQRQNGGYGKADSDIASDLETTYRVMRCFVMLKARPDNVEGVRSFIAKCRNADGGYGVAPGQPSSVSGTYFAGIIVHWLKQNP